MSLVTIPTSHPVFGTLSATATPTEPLSDAMSLKQTAWRGIPEAWEAFCHILDRTVDKALYDLQSKHNVLLADMDAWILIRVVGMWASLAELRDAAEASTVHREWASKVAGMVTFKLAGIVGVRYVHNVFGLIGQTRLNGATPLGCTLASWSAYSRLIQKAAANMAAAVANGRLDVSGIPLSSDWLADLPFTSRSRPKRFLKFALTRFERFWNR